MDKKVKAEDKRARRSKQKEDTDAGTSPADANSANTLPQPSQEELDGLF
ncbi:MAG: hypothetical protein HQ518_08335 [Rhodopirellula sp.]|nr:hypothetical protein [Rhodopirellula sp.]